MQCISNSQVNYVDTRQPSHFSTQLNNCDHEDGSPPTERETPSILGYEKFFADILFWLLTAESANDCNGNMVRREGMNAAFILYVTKPLCITYEEYDRRTEKPERSQVFYEIVVCFAVVELQHWAMVVVKLAMAI